MLSAVNIWSADSEAVAQPHSPPTTAKAIEPIGIVNKAARPESAAMPRTLRPSEILAQFAFASSSAKRASEPKPEPGAELEPRAKAGNARPGPVRLNTISLALQGGGTFAAFTWGVLERLLEEPSCEFDTISGASSGAVNALLLAGGLAEGGRERARTRLAQFWNRMVQEASFRSLMLLGGFSPAGSSVAFGAALRSGHFDPLDLDPLRRVLTKHIDFDALRDPACPRLLIAATRVRDGSLRLFRNRDLTADIVLASTCPPLPHCAIDIHGEAHWDGSYAANPPLAGLVQESTAADVLVVQVTPSRDNYIPVTGAAIDRRLDQIAANSTLNAEIAALQWAHTNGAPCPRIACIAAEDEMEGLAQRSAVDLGGAFVTHLHRCGRAAADRWLRQRRPAPLAQTEPATAQPSRAEPVPA
ncbi:MAG: patatin-like phospholipase family protein [Bradyrhizobium sp.]